MLSPQLVNGAQPNLKQIIEILDQDGCIIISNLLDEVSVSQLKNELDVSFRDAPMCQGNFFGYATKRLSSVIKRSIISRNIAIDPLILSIMDHFLLKSSRAYQLNLTQAIQIHPREPAQIIHTDDLMFPFELPTKGDQKMINCMWAVDDFTVANGATNLVLGSHKWPRERQAEAHEICQGVMPRGSLLIYFGSLLHGGGANTTLQSRTGLVMSYCLGWLRQAENHYLAIPPELVKQLPTRLQRLLGYFVHEPNLGALDGQDPITFLDKSPQSAQQFREFIPEEFHEILAEYRRQAVA